VEVCVGRDGMSVNTTFKKMVESQDKTEAVVDQKMQSKNWADEVDGGDDDDT
jgi:hypothetical protein